MSRARGVTWRAASVALCALLAAGCTGDSGQSAGPSGRPSGSGSGSAVGTVPASFTRSGPTTPSIQDALVDVPVYYGDGCRIVDGVDVPPTDCIYGVPDGTPVALLGDSKIGQWLPALQLIAARERWRLIFLSKSACAYSTAGVATDCARYNARVQHRLLTVDHPRLVIYSQVNDKPGQRDGAVPLLRGLHAAGIRIVALADTPQPHMDVPDCLATASDYYADCGFPRNDGTGTAGMKDTVARVPGIHFVSLNDQICPGTGDCPPVVDHILRYRLGSHLTTTYVLRLAPILHERLIAAGVATGPKLPQAG